MNPVMALPLGDYQTLMLTRELTALVDMGIDSPTFIYGAQCRWGATPDEVQEILEEVRNQ